MDADAVVVVYDEGLDKIIDTIRPIKIHGQDTNLSAADIVRSNDAYNGYGGDHSGVTGNLSRGDAVMVLAKTMAKSAKDPNKKQTMVKAAMDEYNKGNIVMTPKGSFARLLATKGFESIV